jgi:hypothetical protein
VVQIWCEFVDVLARGKKGANHDHRISSIDNFGLASISREQNYRFFSKTIRFSCLAKGYLWCKFKEILLKKASQKSL